MFSRESILREGTGAAPEALEQIVRGKLPRISVRVPEKTSNSHQVHRFVLAALIQVKVTRGKGGHAEERFAGGPIVDGNLFRWLKRSCPAIGTAADADWVDLPAILMF